MDETTVIRVRDVSKIYRIWASPSARLWHLLSGIAEEPGRSPETPRGTARRRRFDDFYALRGVSLDVRRGECVGVLGYNGSGKSTLLQIVAGTVTPTSGSVEVTGRVAALLELGSGFNPEFTGRENVFLYASILGIPRSEMERRFSDVEAFAEIGEFIDQPVRTYSSGMVVRLAFSVLTQIDPDILIIDEALSVGDAYFQSKSMGQIRRFRDDGRSILFVSHGIDMIKSLCDRAVILENGTLIKEGPAEAVADYYNAMVASKSRDLQIRQSEGEGGRIRTRSGNGRARITAIELLDAKDSPQRVFSTGERARLSCVVEFCDSIEQPTVGFLIRDRLGNDVFGTNTYHLGTDARGFRSGETAEFTFDVDLNLGPGRYSVTMAAHAGERHTLENYDWVDNLIGFEVVRGTGFRSGGTAYLSTTSSFFRGTPRRYRLWQPGARVEFGLDGDGRRFCGSGWSRPEERSTWTDGHEAVLLFQFDSPVDRDLTLEMTLAALVGGRLASQRVLVFVGDEQIASWEVSGGESVRTAAVPWRCVVGDTLRILLRLPDATTPSALGLNPDTRILGVRLHALRLV